MADLGEAVGVSYQQIQKYETGANRISASMLYRLAHVLSISPLAFYEGLDNDQCEPSDQAGPDAVRTEITQIVAEFRPEALDHVRHLLLALNAQLMPAQPASRALAKVAAYDPVPRIKKRRHARVHPKAHD